MDESALSAAANATIRNGGHTMTEREGKMKTCARCGETYPATEEYFPRAKQTKSGLVSYCRPCHAARLREWQNNNRDKVRAYAKNARARDPERVRQYSRDYHARQRAKRKEMEQRIAELEAKLSEAAARTPAGDAAGGEGRMRITLDVPPSANKYWRMVNGRMIRSRAANDYKAYAGTICNLAGLQPVSGDVSLSIAVYRPAKRGDLDNYLKVTIDALIGHAYVDDSQIVAIHATRHDDPQCPRIEIEVTQP